MAVQPLAGVHVLEPDDPAALDRRPAFALEAGLAVGLEHGPEAVVVVDAALERDRLLPTTRPIRDLVRV